MIVDKLRYSSVFVLIGALSLAGCMAAASDDEAPPERRVEVAVTFASPADAEAAAASIDRMDDGSMVLAFVGDGAAFDALATDQAQSWLLGQPALLAIDEPLAEPVSEKHHGSCVGHCGEWAGVCGCDFWCTLFGDCCFDYYSVCE